MITSGILPFHSIEIEMNKVDMRYDEKHNSNMTLASREPSKSIEKESKIGQALKEQLNLTLLIVLVG